MQAAGPGGGELDAPSLRGRGGATGGVVLKAASIPNDTYIYIYIYIYIYVYTHMYIYTSIHTPGGFKF